SDIDGTYNQELRLQSTGKPFYLIVEGGRIDHGHHAGNAYRALTDALALERNYKIFKSLYLTTKELMKQI
ncbi:MAG: alkaline phosphatase, partial [Paracoccaceae bacterium]